VAYRIKVLGTGITHIHTFYSQHLLAFSKYPKEIFILLQPLGGHGLRPLNFGGEEFTWRWKKM
jgi:hypothetical protein